MITPGSNSFISTDEVMAAYNEWATAEEVQAMLGKEKMGVLINRLFDNPPLVQLQKDKNSCYYYQGLKLVTSQERKSMSAQPIVLPAHMEAIQDQEYYIVTVRTFHIFDDMSMEVVFGLNTEDRFVRLSIGDKFIQNPQKFGIHFHSQKDQLFIDGVRRITDHLKFCYGIKEDLEGHGSKVPVAHKWGLSNVVSNTTTYWTSYHSRQCDIFIKMSCLRKTTTCRPCKKDVG